MADMFAYLKWRGDLPFSQVPPNAVDALILSTLVYIGFDEVIEPDSHTSLSLRQVAKQLLSLPKSRWHSRVPRDMALLKAAAMTPRFGKARLTFFRSKLIHHEETQFAAVTFLLDDGSAMVTYRGTDYSLAGWKEDFNMSFQDSIPAQREALEYLEALAAHRARPLRLCGHSKGGNLAVFAAAKAAPEIQDRILAVYSHDGPGFTESLMGHPGYLRMVPKNHTYIPESSVVGILLEHEEPFRVIKSRYVGSLQHEPYSWEILGGDFLYAQQTTLSSQFVATTMRHWLADMSRADREAFVDALFGVLGSGGASHLGGLLHPKSILATFRMLSADENTRRLLTAETVEFLKAANTAMNQLRKEEIERMGSL